MTYIVSMGVAILAAGVLQEALGNSHVEADLGSDRYGR